MEPLILVTGAAGKTGLAVIAALQARGANVRALVRRPEQRVTLHALGVGEVLVGDMADLATLREACHSAASVYHICPNMHRDELGIGQRMIDVAQAVGVRRFVYHSVLHPQTEAMPHHWQKLRVEERLFESGLPWTILQPAPYMQNVLAQRRSIVDAGEYPVPYSAATRLALVDLVDVGAAAAVVLLESGHENAIYELAGEPGLSQIDVTVMLGRALGRPVQVVEISRETWRGEAEARGLGGYQLDSLLRMFQYYEAHGLTGNPNILRWLLGRTPTSLAAFVRREFTR